MKKRLLSGIQSTGKIHLGNYFGAIKNWIALQKEYDAYFMVADLHALTTSYEDGINIKNNNYELIADLIACGIDTENATLFLQSQVPEHCELHLFLSMIAPLPWLLRVPTYKSKQEELKHKDLNTYGFLGYPVLQAADILLYQADIVPIGKDQAPHLELTREIVRRFNHLYKKSFFKEPEEMYTEIPILPGTDGRKMSKSYDNAIYLADDSDTIDKKLRRMITDPARMRRTDPGNPAKCPVYNFQKIFNQEITKELAAGCRTAGIGCIDCKKKLIPKITDFIAPIKEKRETLLKDKAQLEKIIKVGVKKSRETAAKTVRQVKRIIKLI